jgi:CPA1 family monovalent cation:H+ antiporter
LSVFYLAVISVAISILIGVLLKFVVFQQYLITTGAFVALMSMVLATDAISVTNIFNQFKLPHSLKFLVEGESLTNDATAVIAYYFVGIPLMEFDRTLLTSVMS